MEDIMTLAELLSSDNTELHLEQIVHPCYLQEANSELSAENTFGKKNCKTLSQL